MLKTGYNRLYKQEGVKFTVRISYHSYHEVTIITIFTVLVTACKIIQPTQIQSKQHLVPAKILTIVKFH